MKITKTRFIWGLWIAYILAITVLVAVHPERRTVTPSYMLGANNWWYGRNLYQGGFYGFLYPPQFAILFVPFERLLPPIGDVLWRWLNLGLFISALMRLSALLKKDDQNSAFWLISLLSIPASLGSARNGQVNMTEAALLIHSAVDIAAGRLWRPVWLLALGIVLKPLAVAMALLVAVVRPMLRWRFAVAAVVVLVFPFAFANFAYVLRQYQDFYKEMTIVPFVGNHLFCDLGGLLSKLRILPPEWVMLTIRAIAAVATVVLTVIAARRYKEAVFSLLLLSLSASYLMIMNPRTECNGYVILAPAVAAFAAMIRNEPAQRRAFWLLVFIALGLGSQNYPLFRLTNLWLNPLLALIFAGYFVSAYFLTDRGKNPAVAQD